MKSAHLFDQVILKTMSIAIIFLFLSSCASMTPLHKAAIQGNVNNIDEYIKEGIPVNKQDDKGNTPLHYAYYYGQKEAIERLEAYGADLTIRNKEGETPLDMKKIANAERLLSNCVQLMDISGHWFDRNKARPLYQQLKEIDGEIVTKVIVHKVIQDKKNRLPVLFVAIKLGIPGSEERLNDVLKAYGDVSMAEDYLNSGSSILYEGGRQWAEDHGYRINTGFGHHRAGWGRF